LDYRRVVRPSPNGIGHPMDRQPRTYGPIATNTARVIEPILPKHVRQVGTMPPGHTWQILWDTMVLVGTPRGTAAVLTKTRRINAGRPARSGCSDAADPYTLRARSTHVPASRPTRSTRRQRVARERDAGRISSPDTRRVMQRQSVVLPPDRQFPSGLYPAAVLAGWCARRNPRTCSIVLAFSSGGSRHGNTVD
jgi:hypothetical protein